MADIFPGATAQQVGGYFPRTGIDRNLALSVVHITAGVGDALSIARSVEAKQVTASFWTNRTGAVVQTMLDPWRMAPWTNGVLNNPDVANQRIAAIVRDKVNPNTRCLVTIENVGLEPGNPITPAQEAACARIIAYYHTKHGVPINRETVVGHYQFDRVNRPNCPSTNKAILDRIVAMATGTLPDTALGDTLTEVTITLFADGPHTFTIPVGGTVHAWTATGTAPAKSQTFPTGSSFPGDGLAVIKQTPMRNPQGAFYRCTAGVFAGLYVPSPQVSDAGPVNPPVTDSALKAQLAACTAELAAATAAAEAAETRIVKLKAEETRHGTAVANT